MNYTILVGFNKKETDEFIDNTPYLHCIKDDSDRMGLVFGKFLNRISGVVFHREVSKYNRTIFLLNLLERSKNFSYINFYVNEEPYPKSVDVFVEIIENDGMFDRFILISHSFDPDRIKGILNDSN